MYFFYRCIYGVAILYTMLAEVGYESSISLEFREGQKVGLLMEYLDF